MNAETDLVTEATEYDLRSQRDGWGVLIHPPDIRVHSCLFVVSVDMTPDPPLAHTRGHSSEMLRLYSRVVPARIPVALFGPEKCAEDLPSQMNFTPFYILPSLLTRFP